MKQTHEPRRDSVARYEVTGNPHPIQARKAWEDDDTWTAGTLLALDDGVVTVAFGADEEPAPKTGLWAGGPVWVTERWNVLAYADEDGNAFAIRPVEELGGSIFARIGHARLRFVTVRLIEETDEETEEDPDEYVYGTVTGLDGVERFHVLPRSVVNEVLEPVEVFNTCSTWGEVRQTASAELYEELLGRAGYGEFETYAQDLAVGRPIPGAHEEALARHEELADRDLPGDDEPFDPGSIAGHLDGDYPPSLEFLQGHYLPADLIKEYGRSYETVLNGTFIELDVARGPELVAELERRGYRCVEDIGLLATEAWKYEWHGNARDQ